MASVNPCAAEIASAVARALGGDVRADDLKVEAPPRPELGDFAVGMFAVAKAQKQPPPALAAKVAAALQPGELIASATAAGPFVNIRIRHEWALRWLAKKALVPAIGAGKVLCIDYSSPNISKHLAYHHIRSTMLGHALAELHRALGWKVIGINHVGDWGTTHGMLLAAYHAWGHEEAYSPLDITALNALYVRYREAMKADPDLNDAARGWFKRLEDGEAEARALWQRFRDISMQEFKAVYELLDVHFDHEGGESFYEDKMPEVVQMLEAKGLLAESEGATVVWLPDEKNPLLVKTRDGTTLYATRDLASALYRKRTWSFDRSLYVVDRGQSVHFRQVFKCLALLGFEWATQCEHVPFGLVRFGGKKTSTRGGAGGPGDKPMLLKEVFAEAIDQVAPIIAEKNPEMDPATVGATAKWVGIGAVVFANVVPQRDRDIDFDWERATSLSGDSGPYLQFTAARCAGIRRKAGNPPSQVESADWSLLTHDAEWAVARRLLDFGDVVARAAAACEPHILAHYLLDLAGDVSRWFTLGNDEPQLRVLVDDPALRSARLALVEIVRHALEQGLGILGLRAPERM
ncbi:MAG: arginine--tRNA ligase [Kofleriaceae bacterium]|nr:MAG: arginine--tRNA ligase [Kofleriaceae bacterium]MBZ0238868.1 arginine--tRNA ligase [Kofleriaceae bacterium]